MFKRNVAKHGTPSNNVQNGVHLVLPCVCFWPQSCIFAGSPWPAYESLLHTYLCQSLLLLPVPKTKRIANKPNQKAEKSIHEVKHITKKQSGKYLEISNIFNYSFSCFWKFSV